MENVLAKHYRRLAERYDDFLYYSPKFIRTLTSKMLEKLQLKEHDRFVDLGCGTCMYSLDIVQQVPLREPIVAVDPFQEMLDQIPADAPVRKVALGALEFSAQPGTYDKILMKEAVHHVDDRRTLFANLYKQLSPGGVLLLVHVPPNVQYPLFKKALERAANWHADPDELVQLLQEAGFAVERDAVDYPQEIPKEKYFQMVEGRYMSALSSLDDDVVEEGLKEMAEKYADQDVLRFIDHFDYLTATKK